MFDNEVRNIANILKKFLGEPKNEYAFDGWSQWNCPCCAERKGLSHDNKYNLEINIRQSSYHCWVCGETEGTKGKLTTLFKKYASQEMLMEYLNELKSIKEYKMYNFVENGEFEDDFEIKEDLLLPYGYLPVNERDYYSRKAFNYLKSRGIDTEIINKFNIGYIGNNYNVPFQMRNRIVVPSYDMYGNLNYWVGRDYSGKSFLRYKNPRLEKKLFIFNEGKVNWYEDITLVEGVFDHIVVPNSIPLLGKSLDVDYTLYNSLVTKARANINIYLDNDAKTNALKIYKLLDKGKLKDRIRLIESNDKDASDLFNEGGRKAVLKTLASAYKLDEFDLLF